MISSVLNQNKEINQVFKLAMLKVMMNEYLNNDDENDEYKDMTQFLSSINMGGQMGEA
jgi:hypothetical protein